MGDCLKKNSKFDGVDLVMRIKKVKPRLMMLKDSK